MWLDLADFALQRQPEDNLMVALSRAWYNGTQIMANEILELHYTMVQFVIKPVIKFSASDNAFLTF